MGPVGAFLILGGCLAGLMLLLLLATAISLWMQSRIAGAPVSIPKILSLQLKQINPRQAISAASLARRHGLDIPIDSIIAHAKAKGRPGRVVSSLVLAKGAEIPFSWEAAARMDLAGQDPVAFIQGQWPTTPAAAPPVDPANPPHAA